MLTIVIPSKNEVFLRKTILDVLKKATGEIEVLPVLDGYEPPKTELVTDPRVRYIRLPAQPYSQKRHGINLAISQAKGNYVMSLDAHCMMAKGFDEQLAKDHQPKWVQIPRRNRLDAIKWSLQPQSDSRPPIDYEYIMFPPLVKDHALHGFKWDERTLKNWDIPIDDTIQFQGSCWFMTKRWFKKMGFMQVEGYTGWGQEAEEISMTTWKNGGRVVTNKNTWYAHLHKGPVHGRMYHLSREENRRSYAYSYNKWLVENKDFFISIIEKFAPLPGWPKDWERRLWPKDAATSTTSVTTTLPSGTTIISNTLKKTDMPKTANKSNTTVIYISSNTEKPEFEQNVRKLLRENCGDIPIISVSRKPIKFGKNISVGNVPVCESTNLRQLLRGLEAAKTEYAIIAKDDFAYPPEYFALTPPSNDHLYRYENIWALGDKFWQKGYSEYAQMGNRKYWIGLIKNALKGHRGWNEIAVPILFDPSEPLSWTSDNAVINFKSTSGLRKFPTVRRNFLPKRALPFWGHALELKMKMGLG
ncbi:MAG: hypothetical protein UW26_C0025G0003 [Candidatus Collierbacteria bacterium GW2011_GWF1_44_12]|uniref:Glycosyltransferase 2-like domain-containing protein n=1 Tax=Candidatus Collierbacteria bacterium GW2011_GWF1_44_12 TaxID=1618402 RepID=A0A0G1JQQ6_9BACT|nr:MAG: hypothetical protein UW26_C0025G0003 [Candidatus Collierbacteria bacterium GW2011_GWF1_44_12]